MLTGMVSLVTELADGEGVESGMVGREGLVGMAGALTGLPAYTRGICQISGAALRIEGGRFREVLAGHPLMRGPLDRYAEGLLNQAQQAVACRAWHHLDSRFCRWLLMASEHAGADEVLLTQEFMAQMLGVQRSTVSQVASELQALDLIRYARGRILIVDRPAVEMRACECVRAQRRRWNAIWADACAPMSCIRHSGAGGSEDDNVGNATLRCPKAASLCHVADIGAELMTT